MSESSTALPESPPRFVCAGQEKFKVVVVRQSDGGRVEHCAELQDLSRGGAQLSTPEPVQLHEAIDLKCENGKGRLKFSAAARVCWVRSDREGNCTVGCAFTAPLSDEAIQSFSSRGYPQGQQFARLPIQGKASVRIETNPSEIDVQLVDISRRGISLFSPEPSDVGGRMRLLSEADSAKEVMVLVRRCAALPGGYLLGCEFRHSADYDVLRGTTQPGDKASANDWSGSKTQPISLISRASILLLGGVLIGTASTSSLPVLNFTLALASVVVFVGLDHSARRRALDYDDTDASTYGGKHGREHIESRLEQLRNWKATPVDVAEQCDEAESHDAQLAAKLGDRETEMQDEPSTETVAASDDVDRAALSEAAAAEEEEEAREAVSA